MTSWRFCLQSAAVAIAVVAGAAPARADYAFTTIDIPTATRGTQLTGINDSGEIVGIYSDPVHSYGFTDIGGVVTTVKVPLSDSTLVTAVNNSGELAGYYSQNGNLYGFTEANGIYTTITDPSAPTQTLLRGIDNRGDLAGIASVNNASAFVDIGGIFTDSKDPQANAVTRAYGINDSDAVVGYYYKGNGQTAHGFLMVGGIYTTIDAPGVTATSVFGINDAGTMVGSADSHGFVDTAGTFVFADAPGATTTTVNGINTAGVIVGSYNDANGVAHGFVATDVPEPPALAVLATSLVGLVSVVRKRSA